MLRTPRSVIVIVWARTIRKQQSTLRTAIHFAKFSIMSAANITDLVSIELLFLGTGTSAGIPMIGCRCAVCTSSDPRDKRTRPSVVISHGATRVLVDTTPELRLQCVANGVERIDAIVFTHAHADHIMGLDDVRRFNFEREGPIDVWADERTFESLGRIFQY